MSPSERGENIRFTRTAPPTVLRRNPLQALDGVTIDENVGIRASRARRFVWADVLKGLAIILAVIGHVDRGLGAAGVIPSDHPSLSFWDHWIYAFHIPAFFFVAGVFAERSLRRGYRDFIVSKAAVLLYPYFLWTTIQWGLHRSMGRFTNVPAEHYNLLTCIYQPYAEFWFFYALFLICAIFATLAVLGFSRSKILLVAATMFVLCEAGAFPLWVPLIQISEYFIIFALGTMAADWCINAKPKMSLAIVGAVASFAVLSVLVKFDWDDMRFLRIVPASAGVCGIYFLTSLIRNKKVANWLAVVGLFSSEIYILHTIAIAPVRTVLAHALHVHRFWPSFFAANLAGVGVPLMVAIAARRYKFPYLFAWPRHRETPVVAEPRISRLAA